MDDVLRAELLRRTEQDQIARRAFDRDAMRRADRENLSWLRDVVAARGWPGASLVGADGASAAWLLAQHADADPVFQRQCLSLLTAAVEAGEAARENLAYLTDRVLLAEGQPQVYGTQVDRRGGTWVPRNLGDAATVDARRAAAGLGPLAEYLRAFDDHPVPLPLLQCPGCAAWVPYEPLDDDEPVTVTCPGCGQQATVTFRR